MAATDDLTDSAPPPADAALDNAETVLFINSQLRIVMNIWGGAVSESDGLGVSSQIDERNDFAAARAPPATKQPTPVQETAPKLNRHDSTAI